ncbi:MAG: dihydrodipicolinate synthase family protein [Phycisphaerales bacterium]|nr:dihydrodipicolinate synthase family protein [Phycisphaerales bacterium]
MIADFMRRLVQGRPIDGCSAVLLPFRGDRPDFASFGAHLRRCHDAGLTPAVNMDTGFGPQLTPGERVEILRETRLVLGDASFIAGASIVGHEVGAEEAYRTEIDAIREAGAMPIIFQSAPLTANTGAALASFYERILAGCDRALAFELGTMFAPFGAIYSLEDFERLLGIEALVGLKHSSLDRVPELQRLDVRDRVRPDFKVYTGNDLAIDMVMFGSDYLLGLSTFDPEAFAQRDRWWAEGDDRFFGLNDALQMLGAVGFRDPVPAYKHSALLYLQESAMLDDELEVHPTCPRRPEWERSLMATCLERVRGAVGAPAQAV